jgi:hypothetical protein
LSSCLCSPGWLADFILVSLNSPRGHLHTHSSELFLSRGTCCQRHIGIASASIHYDDVVAALSCDIISIVTACFTALKCSLHHLDCRDVPDALTCSWHHLDFVTCLLHLLVHDTISIVVTCLLALECAPVASRSLVDDAICGHTRVPRTS